MMEFTISRNFSWVIDRYRGWRPGSYSRGNNDIEDEGTSSPKALSQASEVLEGGGMGWQDPVRRLFKYSSGPWFGGR